MSITLFFELGRLDGYPIKVLNGNRTRIFAMARRRTNHCTTKTDSPRSRTRTGTGFRPGDFKSPTSTYSIIRG